MSYLKNSNVVAKALICNIKSNFTVLENKINNAISSVHDDFYSSGINLTIGEMTDGGYIEISSGNVVSHYAYKYTDYIDIENIKKIGIICAFGANAGAAFYDENHIYISGISAGTASYGDLIKVDVPSGAKYIRSSYYKSSKVDFKIMIVDIAKNFAPSGSTSDNPCSYMGNEICVFNKILCIGDSLTSGTFNYRSGGSIYNYLEDARYSYPTYLHKITNVDVTNKGSGGRSSAEWYEQFANADLSGFSAAIIQLGVNDVIRYSTWGTTSETAFTNIITKLKNENQNIKIFVANIIPATSYSTEGYITFSNALLNWVQTQYANDPDVIPVDIQQYGHTKDSSGYNCGHLSALGYYRLAQDYKGYISNYIKDHLTQFSEVQFIGTDYQFHE